LAIIHFHYQKGGQPLKVLVLTRGRHATCRGDQPLRFNIQGDIPAEEQIVFVPPHGYWAVTFSAVVVKRDALDVVFPPLPAAGPLGWWHEFHGIRDPSIPRGGGVRIGIIDEALAPHKPGSCIAHIINDGGAAWGSGKAKRALNPLCDHAEVVCALLGSRAKTSAGYAGAAPDAEIFFAAAGANKSATLDPMRLVACVDYLSEERQCDIISVSAGDSPEPMPALEVAVENAADRGTVCMFAAGNSRTAKYPARYPNCLAVAALGMRGHAPAGTHIALLDTNEAEPIDGSGVYLWLHSARGPEIEFCAPGVGVIWSHAGMAATASFGTSFSCPILAGVAAILLSQDRGFLEAGRDRTRYNRALAVLRAASKPFGPSRQTLWKYGMLYI
jgi:hypothetical protein